MTLDEVAMLSGEEMVRRYGDRSVQQLVDLVAAAVQRGDDNEVTAIDRRLREVEAVLRH